VASDGEAGEIMAKAKSVKETSVSEMRRYHAESMVSDAVKETPEFKREVKRVMAEIETMEQTTKANVTKRRGK